MVADLGIDRRTFLELVALASGLPAAAGACARPSGRRVVVLGAGLAGLAAAWNLVQRGYDVKVFEAQDIPGGRVKTIRAPFKNGGYAEAGALRIPSTHQWTMKYVTLMGLESKLRTYDSTSTSRGAARATRGSSCCARQRATSDGSTCSR